MTVLRGQALDDFIDTANAEQLREYLVYMRRVFYGGESSETALTPVQPLDGFALARLAQIRATRGQAPGGWDTPERVAINKQIAAAKPDKRIDPNGRGRADRDRRIGRADEKVIGIGSALANQDSGIDQLGPGIGISRARRRTAGSDDIDAILAASALILEQDAIACRERDAIKRIAIFHIGRERDIRRAGCAHWRFPLAIERGDERI